MEEGVQFHILSYRVVSVTAFCVRIIGQGWWLGGVSPWQAHWLTPTSLGIWSTCSHAHEFARLLHYYKLSDTTHRPDTSHGPQLRHFGHACFVSYRVEHAFPENKSLCVVQDLMAAMIPHLP